MGFYKDSPLSIIVFRCCKYTNDFLLHKHLTTFY